jgi:signal transduction histidine kinase
LSQTSVDLLNLFVRPPGELLYFFTVIAVTLASLFMALGQRLRRPDDVATQRYIWALLGVVIAWVMLMAGALLALMSDREAASVLPPLERFASVMTILLIGWAFLGTDEPNREPVPVLMLASVIVVTVIGYGLTATQWIDLAGTVDFNLSAHGATWTFAAAALSVIGIVLVILNFNAVYDAPLKLVFFALLLIGYGGTLVQIAQGNIIGDYAGPVRLAFVAAIVILPAIIYRVIIGRLQSDVEQAVVALRKPTIPTQARVAVPPRPTSPIERESVQLLRVMGMILEEATAESMPERIVQAVIQTLKADVAGLLRMQDANYADIDIAQDAVMKRAIDGISINLDNQPTLVTCIERLSQRGLHPDHNAEELQDFYTRLDIEQIGPLYFQPMTRDKELVAILVVAFPYTQRDLLAAEQEMLKGVAVIAGSLLALAYAANDARLLAEERAIQAMVHGLPADKIDDEESAARAELQQAREQIAELNQHVTQLKLELDDERSRIAADLEDTEEGMTISQQMLALTDEQQRLQAERDSLLQRLQEAEAALQGAVPSSDETMFDDMVEALQREKDDLLNQRDRLQQQLEELRTGGGVTVPRDMQSMLERMAEERLRLQAERDQLSSKLIDIQSQLNSLGIEEGPAGLAQLINQLIEQRALLQTQNAVLKKERDRLLQDRFQFAQRMKHEEEREIQLQSLQKELRNLAGDREAAVKQRDRLRAARDELQTQLDSFREQQGNLQTQVSDYEQELQEAHDTQSELRQQIQQLSDERSDLQNRLDRLLAEKHRIENERDQLIARIEGDRERLEELGANGIGSLTAMINDLTEQRNQLEHELNQSRTTLASLENELEALRMRAGQQENPLRYRPENPELMLGLVQELRTPMTSIIGYIDLLLGESAGILGEMQRKFLQRVSTNVQRLASMLEDLVHVTALDTGSFALEPGPVDVTSAIEDAITNASIQFREKSLSVNLNLDDELPQIHGDRDAISQVIGQLLTNAYLVSPANSEIAVIADQRQMVLNRPDNDDEYMTDCLYISVEDRGGGISPEDEPRVFARKYKADNPLIQGLGDTGVGLSIARTLVEAHGGRLWLETQNGIGSTFCLALPLTSATEPEGLSDAS